MKVDFGILSRWAARNESFIRRWLRRAVTIPFMLVLWTIAMAAIPLHIPLALVLDLVSVQRRLVPRTRCMLFFLVYLNSEVLGLTVGFSQWLFSGVWLGVNRQVFYNWSAALQRWFSKWLYHGARFIFGFRIDVEDNGCAFPGPIILMVRHASSADTPMSQIFIANEHRMMLRWIMKKELLWDPCLDIGGNRLPNVFVDRKSKNREAELMQIRGLAEGMGRHDGILIYPEGTRFSRKKLAASLERLKASGRKELYELALKMKNVLPPRPAGVQEIFDAAPEADVVFCAHAGFEGAVNMYQLLHGALVGALIKMKYWRVPASLIPKGHEERMVWLYERWLEVDRWISEHLDARSSPQPAAATAE